MFNRSRSLVGRMGSRLLSGESSGTVLKTSLYDWHVEHGGKMVEFAGYWLPVQYDGLGVMKGMIIVCNVALHVQLNTHALAVYCRALAHPTGELLLSLRCFPHGSDQVSIHQFMSTFLCILAYLLAYAKAITYCRWTGKDVTAFLEKVTVADIAGLKPSESKLSLVMNCLGGIVDDTVISNAGDHIYMVVNGARKHEDISHFKKFVDVYVPYFP